MIDFIDRITTISHPEYDHIKSDPGYMGCFSHPFFPSERSDHSYLSSSGGAVTEDIAMDIRCDGEIAVENGHSWWLIVANSDSYSGIMTQPGDVNSLRT